MATIASPVPGDQWVVFQDVPWQTYLSLLKARGKGRVRLTYYRGVLEIMTLSKLHEILSEVLDNFVKVLVREYGLEVQSVGSMTMHLEKLQVGGEADKSYYIRHEEVVRERDEYDPAIDPPPDLVVEIDLSSKSTRRMLVFAELGIPELWHYEGERLAFKALGDDGKYHLVEQSLSFSGLTAAGLQTILDRRGTMGEIALDEGLAKYIRAIRKSGRRGTKP
jgi:Uma2 family endonuclease